MSMPGNGQETCQETSKEPFSSSTTRFARRRLCGASSTRIRGIVRRQCGRCGEAPGRRYRPRHSLRPADAARIGRQLPEARPRHMARSGADDHLGYSDCEDIIAGLNEAGIYQYITKRWQPDRLIDIVKKAVQLHRLQKETKRRGSTSRRRPSTSRRSCRSSAAPQSSFTTSTVSCIRPIARLHDVIDLGRRAADYDISVLITGGGRHRQGAVRPRHSLWLGPRQQGVCGRELRRAAG